MATSKREKELARQRAERQAARRAAAAQRRKQRTAIIASVAAVTLVAVAALAVAFSLRPDDPTTLAGAGTEVTEPADGATEPADGASPAGEETEPADGSTEAPAPGECTYTETTTPAAKEVPALPPPTDVETEQPFVATLDTNQGVIEFDLLTSEAPCTVNNMRSLAHFQYYDDTPCHRLTTAGIFVLQCGDPSGTGNGGPGYQFADENLEGATYERGTVAMANSGPGTNGSQFFLVYQDSQLPPNYTPFGRITKGLDVLDKIAEAGATPEGDGEPNLEVQIETLRTRAAS